MGVDSVKYLEEHTNDILDNLRSYLIEVLEEIDMSSIKVSPHHRRGYEDELIYEIDRILESELDHLSDQLYDAGLEPNKISRDSLRTFKPEPHRMADRFEQGILESHTEPEIYGRRGRKNSKFSSNDRDYIRNLFS